MLIGSFVIRNSNLIIYKIKAIINGKKVEVIDDSKLVTQPAQFSVEDVFKAPNVKGVAKRNNVQNHGIGRKL
ncbi:417_t:CDS:2 [Funneliformis geosporum]|nr:417_t:CDS:2 [Funneliformis geosporum]